MKMTADAAVDDRNTDESLRSRKVGSESLTLSCHEMLTQLTIISLSTGMLRESLGKTLSEKQVLFLGKIEHSLDDLFGLIRDLDRIAGNREASPLF